MKVILSFIVFAMIVFVTFGLPFSFFFASALMLKAVLIVVGVGVFTVGFAVKVNGRLAAPFLTVVMLFVISVGSLNRYFPTFSCLFA